MLGKLFKPRWQHRDAEVRAQAVATLDPRQDQETLSKLARDDDSARVRAAAVSALLDLHLLDRLIEADGDAGVRDAASERFVALLAGTVDGAPAVDTRLRLIQHSERAIHMPPLLPDATHGSAALAVPAEFTAERLFKAEEELTALREELQRHARQAAEERELAEDALRERLPQPQLVAVPVTASPCVRGCRTSKR